MRRTTRPEPSGASRLFQCKSLSINMNKPCFEDLVAGIRENYISSKEAQIIIMRYGIIDGVSHTLEEVGRVFGVTRERVRQIEAKGLGRLRLKTKIRQ